MKSMVALCSVFLLCFGSPAQTNLPRIAPAPQEIAWTSASPSWLSVDKLTGVRMVPGCEAAIKRLSSTLGMPLPELQTGAVALRLENLPDTIPARSRDEAYQLIISAEGLRLSAQTPHGLHNGLISVSQLAVKGKGLPCVRITDWPDLLMRGSYAPSIGEAEAHFEDFVTMKLNLVVVEDGQLYDLAKPEINARFQKFRQRCEENHIDFVPELQSLGWGHFVLQREPRAVEARYRDKKAFPVKEGRLYALDPPLAPKPTIKNSSFEAGMAGWKAQSLRERWTKASEKEVSVVAMTAAAGGQALRLVSEGEGTVRVEQDIEITPNASYELRCMLKTEGITGRGAFTEVYGVNKNGSMGEFIGHNEHPVRGSRDWHLHTVRFNTGGEKRARPGGSLEEDQEKQSYDRVRIYIRIQQGAGMACFDQLKVLPIQSPNPLDNVIVSELAQVLVQNEAGTITYEEAKDYTLHVPNPIYPFAEGAPMELSVTEGSRIQDGDTLLLSYHYARRGDITCCPTEPLYRDFLQNAIREVLTQLKPKYLHIGHDEPRFFNRDGRCRDRHMSNEDLFVDDIERTRAFAKEVDPKIRVMMWDDAINPYQNGPSLKTAQAAEKLARDIIINVWWYDNNEWDKQMDKSLDYFLDLGFDTTGSPWFRFPNAYHWAELLEARKENPKSLGVIYTSWAAAEPWAALKFTAEHAWSFGKPAYAPQS